MTQEALKELLETVEAAIQAGDWKVDGACDPDSVIRRSKEALAQPEQEPVALHVYKPKLPRDHLGNVSDGDLPWVYDQDPSSGYSARMLVYSTPPQRTWVGLTDEEIDYFIVHRLTIATKNNLAALIRICEAKLKEKNT